MNKVHLHIRGFFLFFIYIDSSSFFFYTFLPLWLTIVIITATFNFLSSGIFSVWFHLKLIKVWDTGSNYWSQLFDLSFKGIQSFDDERFSFAIITLAVVTLVIVIVVSETNFVIVPKGNFETLVCAIFVFESVSFLKSYSLE